jgi:predicted metalloprotease
MAAVQIIAHEVGHAVAFQLGHRSRTSYDNEATADCLSGAFAQTSEMRGTLEQGDLDEAEHAISLAGDPRLQLTGNRRMDRQIQREAAMRSHGTADQRWQNFNLGLKGGAGACLAEFRS